MARKSFIELQHTEIRDLLQNSLNSLCLSNNNDFDEPIWVFNIGRHNCTLDFSIFESKHMQFCNDVTAEFNDTQIPLSLTEMAKLIWLEQVRGLTPGSTPYRGAFNGVALLFAFLFEEDASELNKKLLDRYMSFVLTRDVTLKGVIEKFSSPSYGSRIAVFSLSKLMETVNRFNIVNIIHPIGKSVINSSLNDACESILGMTAAEYKEGGSFNFLGLDVGKHYIDHCHNVFENHYVYISALHDTFVKCLADKRCSEIYENKRDSVEALVTLLKGDSPPAYQHHIVDKLQSALPVIHRKFRKAYRMACKALYPFQLDVINAVLNVLGIPDNYDGQEFVRSLVYVDWTCGDIKSKTEIWHEYIATLPSDSVAKHKTLEDFNDALSLILNKLTPRLPSDKMGLTAYLQKHAAILDADIFNTKTRKYKGQIEGAVRNLARAGTTCFIAATGWRSSEFGFSLNDISITINSDVLDNYYTPFRIIVTGEVPKTGGPTKHRREISLQCLILLKQIAHLKQINILTETLLDPAHSMQNNVQHLWEDFVQNYSLFRALDENKAQAQETSTSITREILSVRNQVRRELPRVKLCILHRFSANLTKYINGQLSDEDTEVFEKHLTNETKQKIKNGKFRLSKDERLTIRAELLMDTVYPTPHAFRHIWAEAVLRRYRGDIGKFIQANFKHMDSRFFMAYLRGKMATTMKKIFELAERTFINSIVLRHIESMNDDRREYAGQIDRYVSKAVRLTNVTSQLEFEKLALKISDEKVVSAKPNPWCTCIFRLGTERSAKCSLNGLPQRQNASPALCLGCINADISAGNFNGIVVYIKSDIEACLNPVLPKFIKEPHIEQLRIARKRVNELYQNSGKEKYKKFIGYLDETLGKTH